MLRVAFDVADKAIRGLLKHGSSRASFLSTYIEILGDARFKERAIELATTGMGIGASAGGVAREVIRAAHDLHATASMEERARHRGPLRRAHDARGVRQTRRSFRPRRVIIGDALTVFDVLVMSRAQPVAIALTERSTGPKDAHPPRAHGSASHHRRPGALSMGIGRGRGAGRRGPRPLRDDPSKSEIAATVSDKSRVLRRATVLHQGGRAGRVPPICP